MGFKETFQLKSDELDEKKVFRDVVHDYIHVSDKLIWELIDSEEMQRLRRIKQLGGTYQVFPTGEHSRFTHSLGVYEIVREMLEQDCLKDEVSDYDKLTVMCAALLHDIGHGPFSHLFEDIYNHDHEKMTVRIIMEDSQVHTILAAFYEELPLDVAKVILKTHENPLLVQMLSSQLDADRMDYLLRDSYFTGTTYGHFDKSRLMRTMRVYEGKIVFKESGVHAIENYILARYHMYWQVYYHPVARSYEFLLKGILLRLNDLYKDHYHFHINIHYLEPFLIGNISVKDFIELDETVLSYYIKEFINEEDNILSDLSYRFMNRRLFKYCDYKDSRQYHDIQEKTIKLGYNPDYYVIRDVQKQVPYETSQIESLEEIMILTPKGLEPLPKVSDIVNAIVNTNKYKEEERIYYLEEIEDEL